MFENKYVSAFQNISQYLNLVECWDAPLRKTQEYYSDVTWVPWCLKSPSSPLFIQGFVPTSQYQRKHQSSALLARWEGNRCITSRITITHWLKTISGELGHILILNLVSLNMIRYRATCHDTMTASIVHWPNYWRSWTKRKYRDKMSHNHAYM